MSIRHLTTTPDGIRIEADISPRGNSAIHYMRGKDCHVVHVRRPTHHSLHNVNKMADSLKRELVSNNSKLSMELEAFRIRYPHMEEPKTVETSVSIFTPEQIREIMDGVQRAAGVQNITQAVTQTVAEIAREEQPKQPEPAVAQEQSKEPEPTPEPQPEAEADEVEVMADLEFEAILNQKAPKKAHPDIFWDHAEESWFFRYEDLDDPVVNGYRKLRTASHASREVLLALMKRIDGHAGMRVVPATELCSTGRMRRRCRG